MGGIFDEMIRDWAIAFIFSLFEVSAGKYVSTMKQQIWVYLVQHQQLWC
jgi:hypothetical protein